MPALGDLLSSAAEEGTVPGAAALGDDVEIASAGDSFGDVAFAAP